MKYRDKTVICWELLRALASRQQIPSRLARMVNVPYDRLPEYTGPLVAGGLVKVEAAEGHDSFSITPRGMEALGHLDSALKLLFS